MICIHAPITVITHEKWIETIEDVSACSDGVTIDLTPPIPGNVYIGIDSADHYQVKIPKQIKIFLNIERSREELIRCS